MQQSYELLYRIEERGKADKNGQKAHVVVDSEGYICGVYSTANEAEKAIPAIRRNVEKGFINPAAFPKVQNRTQVRQSYKRK